MPFASEDHSTACVAEPECVRQHLGARHREPPELLPERFAEGFRFHDQRWSIKQPLWTRRIELTATGQLLQRRPSCLMPSMVARTDEGEKALDLRHWGVPCAARCDVCGRSPMVWYRAEVALGRPSIVGSTVKQPQRRPEDLLADEKPTWAFGHTGYVPTTVGGGGLLGAAVAEAASAEALEAASGACAHEARTLWPADRPQTVCTDGWDATPSAWKSLLPAVCSILCCLHAVRNVAERGGRDLALRTLVLDRVWEVDDACTRAQCSQRLRRLREWATTRLSEGAVRDMVLKLGRQGPQFVHAYRFPTAPRTSKALDRLLNHQDRRLSAMRDWHGTPESARLAVRAMAVPWNFHPYGARCRGDDRTRRSPFHDRNGFESHPHWLHNLLMASSMGGRR